MKESKVNRNFHSMCFCSDIMSDFLSPCFSIHVLCSSSALGTTFMCVCVCGGGRHDRSWNQNISIAVFKNKVIHACICLKKVVSTWQVLSRRLPFIIKKVGFNFFFSGRRYKKQNKTLSYTCTPPPHITECTHVYIYAYLYCCWVCTRMCESVCVIIYTKLHTENKHICA